MRFCKDCKHLDGVGTLCIRGRYDKGIEPVHGRPITIYPIIVNASDERKAIMPWRCGKKGRHWEARYGQPAMSATPPAAES